MKAIKRYFIKRSIRKLKERYELLQEAWSYGAVSQADAEALESEIVSKIFKLDRKLQLNKTG